MPALETVAFLHLRIGGVEHPQALVRKPRVDLIEVLTNVGGFSFRGAAPMRVTRILRRAVVDLALGPTPLPLRRFGRPGLGDVSRVGLVKIGLERGFELLTVALGQVDGPRYAIPCKRDFLGG